MVWLTTICLAGVLFGLTTAQNTLNKRPSSQPAIQNPAELGIPVGQHIPTKRAHPGQIPPLNRNAWASPGKQKIQPIQAPGAWNANQNVAAQTGQQGWSAGGSSVADTSAVVDPFDLFGYPSQTTQPPFDFFGIQTTPIPVTGGQFGRGGNAMGGVFDQLMMLRLLGASADTPDPPPRRPGQPPQPAPLSPLQKLIQRQERQLLNEMQRQSAMRTAMMNLNQRRQTSIPRPPRNQRQMPYRNGGVVRGPPPPSFYSKQGGAIPAQYQGNRKPVYAPQSNHPEVLDRRNTVAPPKPTNNQGQAPEPIEREVQGQGQAQGQKQTQRRRPSDIPPKKQAGEPIEREAGQGQGQPRAQGQVRNARNVNLKSTQFRPKHTVGAPPMNTTPYMSYSRPPSPTTSATPQTNQRNVQMNNRFPPNTQTGYAVHNNSQIGSAPRQNLQPENTFPLKPTIPMTPATPVNVPQGGRYDTFVPPSSAMPDTVQQENFPSTNMQRNRRNMQMNNRFPPNTQTGNAFQYNRQSARLPRQNLQPRSTFPLNMLQGNQQNRIPPNLQSALRSMRNMSPAMRMALIRRAGMLQGGFNNRQSNSIPRNVRQFMSNTHFQRNLRTSGARRPMPSSGSQADMQADQADLMADRLDNMQSMSPLQRMLQGGNGGMMGGFGGLGGESGQLSMLTGLGLPGLGGLQTPGQTAQGQTSRFAGLGLPGMGGLQTPGQTAQGQTSMLAGLGLPGMGGLQTPGQTAQGQTSMLAGLGLPGLRGLQVPGQTAPGQRSTQGAVPNMSAAQRYAQLSTLLG